MSGSGPERITSGEVGIGVAIVELGRIIREEICDGSIGISTVSVLQEQVVELVVLVVGTYSEGVVAGEDGKVVGEGPGVGIHGVCTGGVLGSEVNHGLLSRNVHVGTLIRHFAMVALEHCGYTEVVVDLVAQTGVELGDDRMCPCGHLVAGIVEVVGIASGAVIVLGGIHQLIADHELVGLVDVPVHAAQKADGAGLYLMGAVALGEIAIGIVGLLVMVDHRGGEVRSEVSVILASDGDRLHEVGVVIRPEIGRIDVGIRLIEVFRRNEEEELVLDDRSSHGGTDGAVEFLVILLAFCLVEVLLHLLLVAGSGSDEVLVEEETVCATLHFVGTGLGDGVDGTAGESALPYIERSYGNLDFFNGVDGDRVGAGLSAVGSGSCKTEAVLCIRTVDGEGVVAVVGSCDGDTAVLVAGHLGTHLGDVIDAAVDRRSVFHLAAVERSTCACYGRAERLLCHNRDRLELVGAGHCSIKYVGLAEGERNAGVVLGLHSEEGNFHGVRTAGTHSVDMILPLVVGNSIVGSSGRSVNCIDHGAGKRFAAFVNDSSTQRSSCHLRVGRNNKQSR